MEYIDPGALRPFFAVAREGSFVRAARALKVQQPAVSKAVRVLEERLGATLLERRKTGATLTPAGRRVYERCLRIFDELGLLVADAKTDHSALEGDLWIAANEHVATHLLPPAIAAVRTAHPRVVPRILTGAAHLLVPDIVAGRVELGLFFKVEATARLDRRAIARADCQVVVARTAKDDENTLTSFIGSREVDDLSNKDFPTLRLLKRERPATRITISCSSLEAHRHLVLAGCGISILPVFVVARDLAERTMTRVMPDYVYRAELLLVTRRGAEFSPPARELLRRFRRSLRDVPTIEARGA